MDDNGDTREDLNLPPGDLGKDIKDRFEKGETIAVSWNFLFMNSSSLLKIKLRSMLLCVCYLTFLLQVTVLNSMGEEQITGVKNLS